MKVLGVLDRYILRQWLGTFILSALGVPAVSVLIHLSEFFGKLTSKGVPLKDIFRGEAYLFPPQVAMLLPAAVLFATVFTLNSLGRHSELTAVKAGGISFFRLVFPMVVLSAIAVPANFALQEFSAYSATRQRELEHEKPPPTAQFRNDAAYASDIGWIYGATTVQREPGIMTDVLLDLPAGRGPEISVTSHTARWFPTTTHWVFDSGTTYIKGTGGRDATIRFSSLVIPKLKDPPKALMDEQKKAEEMRYREFQEYLVQLKRSSIKPGQLEVDFYLKIALPVACLIVALFGAPLAVTTPRSGAALGLAMALGSTLVYLTGTQIMKAIGGKGLITPIEAAWSMNVVFLVLGLILLSRVRS